MRTGFEHFAGLGNVLILPAQADEQIATAYQSAAERGGRDAGRTGCFDEHARIPWMHGEAQHLAADGGQVLRLRIDGPEDEQELFRALDGLRLWFIQPIKL